MGKNFFEMQKIKLIGGLLLGMMVMAPFFVVQSQGPQAKLTLDIYAGALRLDIVDENYESVEKPFVAFDAIDFSFAHQKTTGTLGTMAPNIWVQNPSPNQVWEVTIAATEGPTMLWVDDRGNDPWDGTCPSVCMDFNSGTGIGQLTIDPSDGYVYREDNGSIGGIVLGDKKSFVQGSTDSITLFRSTAAEAYHAYSLTNVVLAQTIPGGQRANRTYVLPMTLTIS